MTYFLYVKLFTIDKYWFLKYMYSQVKAILFCWLSTWNLRVVQGYSRHAWLPDLFPVKCEFKKLYFMIHYLKVLRDPWRTWIINRYLWFYHSVLCDFEMQVLQMVRVVYQEWLGMQIICNMEPRLSYSWFCFQQTLFLLKCKNRLLKSNLLSYFRDSGKQNFFVI